MLLNTSFSDFFLTPLLLLGLFPQNKNVIFKLRRGSFFRGRGQEGISLSVLKCNFA